MNKKQIILVFGALILALAFFFVAKPVFTGQIFLFENSDKLVLGYCPTMLEDAGVLSEMNDYELVKFDSSSEVLHSLNNGQIDFGLIGRKAKNHEVSGEISEEVLKSGYTLISNEKRFVEYRDLQFIEIHTYLPESVVNSLVPSSSNVVYHDSIAGATSKISEDNVVLISWDGWEDEFELLIVIDGGEKVKDFRGAFLYY
ncbi:MAG: hypothetical protein WDZ69_00680 [Candidatus Pacearchaeota archaeon]